MPKNRSNHKPCLSSILRRDRKAPVSKKLTTLYDFPSLFPSITQVVLSSMSQEMDPFRILFLLIVLFFRAIYNLTVVYKT